MNMTVAKDFDMIIVGGGLSGALLAWRMKHKFSNLSIKLVERDNRLGGNHTWCFFDTDLTPSQRHYITPLIVKQWPSYAVHFPEISRTIQTGYAAISSSHFHDVIAQDLGDSLLTDTKIIELNNQSIKLENGQIFKASCVIDARGATSSPHLALRYQKFLALELELSKPHGLSDPIIMDATVSQDDGYRFLYTLPFSSNRLLIYDTYYSDEQTLSAEKLKKRILDYSALHGWNVASILREERGVLPIILAGDLKKFEHDQVSQAPKIGLAGALFHPTTGYSLPDALRITDLLTQAQNEENLTTEIAQSLISSYRQRCWRRQSYFRLLNRMLFQAGAPEARYKILERFYKFDTGLIQRFYAANLKPLDRLRIVFGKPPVPLLAATRCFSEARTLQRWEK
jgi:lycopene beta-cyclase